MPTGQQKIRIYDLAKELKLDNKKVMEDARREGIDCSVPSNTVPHEVAERIRLKYFPKKLAPQVGPRLVKHVKPVEPVEPPPAAPEPEPAPEFEAAADQKAEPATPEPQRPKVRVLKAAPQPQTSAPAKAAAEQAESQAAEPEETDSGSAPYLPEIAPTRPPTQVRVLRP